jgi:murein DD-endopeptidase MepM/ murein hydrolase activator NlpD
MRLTSPAANPLKLLGLRLSCASVLLLLCSLATQAASDGVNTKDCGDGIALRLSALETPQGSLVAAVLVSPSPLGELKASWDGRDLPFWTESPWQAGGKEEREALLGIDLEKPLGAYEVLVSGQTRNSQAFTCQALIKVNDGHFATERLHVAKQFAEPDPEQVKRANAERDKLRGIFDHITPVPLWDGGFREPLDSVKTGGNFGKRRVLNGISGSPHGGVDFPAPTGTPVHSAQAGTIVLAEEFFFSGNTVVVDHGLGIYTFYGHLSAFDVKAGDSVKSGQVLGKVGATGRVTGPHLHWALTVNRARVNALDIVKLLGSH